MTTVHGDLVDDRTRCVHYHGPSDVIAIKHRCCGRFYACAACHESSADHPAERWKEEERHEPAVLCGICRTMLTIHDYLSCDSRCPHCGAGFNPGCRHHHHLYFAGKDL